jgi:hypothetical protein
MKTLLIIIILTCLVQAQEKKVLIAGKGENDLSKAVIHDYPAEHYYLGLDGKLTNTEIRQTPEVGSFPPGWVKGSYTNHGSISITVPYRKYANTDSLEAICKERGHIRGNTGNITLLANIPRYVDLPDRTIIINHDRNSISYRCQRCGKGFSEPVQVKPGAVIIWQK